MVSTTVPVVLPSSYYPLHFLDCRASRPLATARHDRLLHTLVRIARSVGIAVVVEPRLSVDDKSRTDGNFYLVIL